jgi:hypothetical protein
MKKLVLITILALVTLTQSACGTMGHIVSTYGAFSNVERSEFDYQGETYRMFDRKDLSKVMITPSLGTAAANGFVRGATLYSVNLDNDEARYKSVAVAFLAKERMQEICSVTESKLLITPQWEFVYLCSKQ